MSSWPRIWRSFSPAGATHIHPGQGLIVQRSQPTTATLVLKGMVSKSPLHYLLQPGDNLVSFPRDRTLTLDQLSLSARAGWHAATNMAAADNLIQLHEDGRITLYFYSSRPGYLGWRTVTLEPSGSVAIPPGGTVYLRRKLGSLITWMLL